MKRYLIVVEQTDAGFFASSPDLPGWSSTAHTREALEKNMRQAIASYLDSLRIHGQPLPAPCSYAVCVEFPD
ncbi:MAG: type II toxin-antitoxin system HicB family antitoxin [Acidobacteriia bacterium]|nr:type II toxin-antitoxin system HicB family antitoxin [Terriglobia bacterium]